MKNENEIITHVAEYVALNDDEKIIVEKLINYNNYDNLNDDEKQLILKILNILNF